MDAWKEQRRQVPYAGLSVSLNCSSDTLEKADAQAVEKNFKHGTSYIAR